MPENQQQPSFLQIHFVGDEDNAKDIHCGIYPGVKSELVIHHNCYNERNTLEFTTAVVHVPKDQKNFKVVINADRKPSKYHQACFNAPTYREVAGLVSQVFEKKDIIIHSTGDKVV